MFSRVAERLRWQISLIKMSGRDPITASIGISNWPANEKEVEQIVTAADDALCDAKKSGGNQSKRA